jgi:Flp pilus assembly protein TadG
MRFLSTVRSISRASALRSEDGAAAVEFALISTLLFLILFGIIEFGQAYSQYQVFQGAAREGGRVAAVSASDPSFNPGDVQARVIEAAQPFDVTRPVRTSVEGGGTVCTDETRGDHVTVKWRQIFDIQLPFVPPLDTRIWISAVFRCE